MRKFYNMTKQDILYLPTSIIVSCCVLRCHPCGLGQFEIYRVPLAYYLTFDSFIVIDGARRWKMWHVVAKCLSRMMMYYYHRVFVTARNRETSFHWYSG